MADGRIMHGVSGRNSGSVFVCIKSLDGGSSKWERYSRAQSGRKLISFVDVYLEAVPPFACSPLVAALWTSSQLPLN